ncbi:MAG: hypothetical protein G01um101425_808 [Candidatus Peregrinibacteria bacterium Gr01-1014_25]|nr:MAG: hypothetical protein G01um101425_808 [Candidatus Peregrinibacteria bacterium Gr01-1014_25]
MHTIHNIARAIALLPRRILGAMIIGYQCTLSPDHGPLKALHPYGFCRHEPTCSLYARQVIATRGALTGSLLTIRRLLTCHPWASVSEEKILKLSER